MCVMSPLPKTAPASAQATLLRFWLPVATWLLLLFIAQGLLTSLLPVASFPTIPAGLSTSCFPEPPPSNNSQALVRHLGAIDIGLHAQLAWKGGHARRWVRSGDEQWWPGAGTPATAHRRRRLIGGAVIERHPLGSGENGLRLPIHDRHRRLNELAGTACGWGRAAIAIPLAIPTAGGGAGTRGGRWCCRCRR